MSDPIKFFAIVSMYAIGFKLGWWAMDKLINHIVEKREASRAAREAAMKNITPRRD